jgi:hypothetical protein
MSMSVGVVASTIVGTIADTSPNIVTKAIIELSMIGNFTFIVSLSRIVDILELSIGWEIAVT